MNKPAVGAVRVAAARAEAERAREAALATAHELAERLAPKTIARNAWQGAKVKGADMAEASVDAVRRRPLAATGAVAALVLFLAREPIRDAIVDLYEGMTSDRDEHADDQSNDGE